METFLHDFENKLIRFWVFKKMFTPLEHQQKYFDQSQYESTTAMFGYIKVCVNLGSGDYLVGIQPEFGDGELEQDLYFYRLSELRFQILEIDQPEEEE